MLLRPGWLLTQSVTIRQNQPSETQRRVNPSVHLTFVLCRESPLPEAWLRPTSVTLSDGSMPRSAL
jgi:hypothetical protein